MRHCPSHEWDAYAANYGEDDRTAFERFMANRLRTAINLPRFEFRFTLLGILQMRGEWKRTRCYYWWWK